MLASSSRQALSATRKRIPVSQKYLSGRLLPAFESSAYCQQQRHATTSSLRPAAQQEYDEEFEYDVPASPHTKNLRNLPYQYTPDFAPRPHAFSFNQRLETASAKLHTIQIFQILKEMKDTGSSPDIITYNATLEALGKRGMEDEAWALLEDMMGMQISPTIQSFNFLLLASRNADLEAMYRVLRRMSELGVEPDTSTYVHVIRKFVRAGNLEMAILYLVEMEEKGLSPRLEIAEDIITLAASKGHPRLAIDLAVNFEASTIRALSSQVWIKCLISATDHLYKEGVDLLWHKIVHELKLTPDEGTCLEVMNTAGRHGLPELCMDALRVLQSIGVTIHDYHFAPVVEAFSRLNRLKDAFSTLSLMRSKGLVPTPDTAHPIFNSIRTSPDTVDVAWTALEELEKEGQSIDITAVNVVIQAAVAHGDLQRAIGIYQIIPEFKIKPNVDTFNALFSGCIATAHKDLGEKLLVDMKEAKVKPDAQTYERLIVLSLSGETYEEAFFYLEEMKAANFYPPLSVYESMIVRCADAGDTRYKIALEELQEFGYEVSPGLEKYVGARVNDANEQKRSNGGSRSGRAEMDSSRGRPTGTREGGDGFMTRATRKRSRNGSDGLAD